MPRRSSDRGFTLLEVLAAVAILGLWYVVLAGISIQGLRAEGESDRRLRASLLADEVLADLEAQLNLGVIPPGEESERGDFRVQVDVVDLSLSDVLPPEQPGSDPGRASPPPPAEASASLFAAAAGGASPLRRIRVQVFWPEGFEEHSVSRTTFGLDRQAVLPILEGLQAAGALGNGDGIGAVQ